ncbi:HTH domain-containing protein [uncultured Ruegeria sp.]|uniref:HTH domain-containing protein n=1 Tax=uncultured Ruegeria sp. TaxID=259304 RepID=UPI002638918A|nr:HTH domain-containing protein [uncultured Ruegeria sp.]
MTAKQIPDWCGEHLIRCAQRETEPETDTSKIDLDLRRKKVAELIKMNLTAPEIARRLGVPDGTVYRDAAKLKMNMARKKRKTA